MSLLAPPNAKDDNSPMDDSSSANPIFRRLGIKDGEDHFNGGRSGNEFPELIKYMCEAIKAGYHCTPGGLLKSPPKLHICNTLFAKQKHVTKASQPCTECGDKTGKRLFKNNFNLGVKDLRCRDCYENLQTKVDVDATSVTQIQSVLKNNVIRKANLGLAFIIEKLAVLLNASTDFTDEKKARRTVVVTTLKGDALKSLRKEFSDSIGDNGFSVPNIGTNALKEVLAAIERAHSFVPELWKLGDDNVNVDAMVNSLCILASDVTRTYISDLIVKLSSYGIEVRGLMTWRLLTEGVRLGCSVEENSDLLSKYESHAAIEQGDDSLLDYLTAFDQSRADLDADKTDEDKTSPVDSVHNFVVGMSASVKTVFLQRFALQYPDTKLTWANVRIVVMSLKDYKGRKRSGGGLNAGITDTLDGGGKKKKRKKKKWWK